MNPSGAALHAKAIRCASCLPIQLAAPGPVAVESLMAASLAILHVPLPRSGDRGGGDQERVGKSHWSGSPWSALSRESARFTVRTDALPRWDTSLRRERSAIKVSSTLYLTGSHG